MKKQNVFFTVACVVAFSCGMVRAQDLTNKQLNDKLDMLMEKVDHVLENQDKLDHILENQRKLDMVLDNQRKLDMVLDNQRKLDMVLKNQNKLDVLVERSAKK